MKKQSEKTEKNLYRRFVEFIDENGLFKSRDRVVVAVSGGPDSVCLFYLLLELAKERNIKLVVAHYNHSMRGRKAVRDEIFVRDLAEKEGIPFICERAIKGQIKSEESARDFRYKFLEKARGERGGDVIAVAHNKDDLGETLLLNLVRGTGIRGIRSMPVRRGRIIRPLLFAKRSEIEKFLQDQGLESCHDESNDSPIFSRNFIRLKILPLFKKLNPKFLDALARTANLASDYQKFISDIANKEIEKISHIDDGEISIDRKKFVSLSPVIQSEIICVLAENHQARIDLSATQIEEILALIAKNVGKKHKIIAGRLKFELSGGRIIVSEKRG